jgi:hypothetical protein
MIISEIKLDKSKIDIALEAQENARNSVYSGIMKSYIEWVQKVF